MKLEYVPLLHVQHELQDIPRGTGRFRQYLRTILNDRGDDVRLPPLVAANPMAKEHVTALLDDLLAADADGAGARAAAEASKELAGGPGAYQVALVVIDDLKGGWTNRADCEFALRFGTQAYSDDGWLAAVLWSSEPAPPGGLAIAAREAVLTVAHRAAYVRRQGPALTLRDRMIQEGHVMAAAGCTRPVLESDDLAYTREVLAPHLDATDRRTCTECLFGDKAAKSLGFTPRGLSDWAGLAVALHDATAGVTVDGGR